MVDVVQERRPWGGYNTLSKAHNCIVKQIIVEPGHRLSKQYHLHRSEHWVVIEGMALVEHNEVKQWLRPGESIFIRAGDIHRLSNNGRIRLVMVEVQHGEFLSEEDIIRTEDDYSRH